MSNVHIALGLWPIAGITTLGVTAKDANLTLAAAIESGITTFDTAFSYGFEGESDRLLGRNIKGQREQYTIIGKWDNDGITIESVSSMHQNNHSSGMPRLPYAA